MKYIPAVFIIFAALSTFAIAQFDVDNLEFMGSNLDNFAHLMDIEVESSKAYASVGFFQGLETYDISNPFSPVRLAYAGNANWRSKAYGDTLFVFCRQNGLNVFDLGHTTQLVGQCSSGGGNILFEGGALVGSNLFVAVHQEGIVEVDVSNLNSPTVEQTYPLTENACWNVESVGDYLFIANGRFGLSVGDVSDGFEEIANLSLPGLANDIVLYGNDIAVLTLGVSGIATVDISDPADPILMDIHPSLGCAWGCGIMDGLVAVGSWRYLELFNVSDPESIQLAGWENTKTWAMGADISLYMGSPMITEADWRGMANYKYTEDPAPDIDVYPLRLDFGEVSGGADSVAVVTNTGTGTLNITNIATPNGFTASPSSLTLESGESAEIWIHSNGTSMMGTIHYYNDSSNESDFKQYVYANNLSYPQAGSIAPDFTLQGTDSNWYTLSDLRGNVIFLEFGGGW